MTLSLTSRTYDRDAADRLAAAAAPGLDGARALVETFYRAFNTADAELLVATWRDDPLVQLNNPLGGLLRGRDAIAALYARVFDGAGRAWIAFEDVVEMDLGDTVVFAGRERGAFTRGDHELALAIRTSRIVAFDAAAGGWRMVHHHGSIDDAADLRAYQDAVAAAAAS